MALFGVDIAKTVSDATDGQLLPATLTREDPGTYDPETDTYTGGGADLTFTTEGIVEQYDKKLIAEGLVQSNDRKILLIAEKLGTTPSPGVNGRKPDRITIEGETFTVVAVEKDPADATYTVQGRL